VSGCRGPDIPEPDPLYHLPDEEFRERLTRFDGIPEELLQNKQMFEIFLPMLRADFTMDETYYSREKVRLNCTITAWGGTRDAEATEEEIKAWKEYTSAQHQYRMFRGGHFYIREDETTVLKALKAVITGDA
jgi:surfactin synthase thioesterase subunit